MHGQHTAGSIAGYQALTEREKQTLRLLLDGHDAKSMARHLDLSVHTINERLRDARRKLAVSSSKEAARLLRRAEGSPQSLGDKPFGDAEGVATDPSTVEPSPSPPRRRPAGWAIGGLVMMIAAVAAILALTTTSPTVSLPAAQASASSAAPSAAAVAARRWLELGDAGRWDEALAATGEPFRTANSPEVWRSVSEKVRVPLGRVLSRTLVDDQEVPTPPRVGRVVRFRTDFADRKGATETLSLQREGDAWKVVGIYLE